jgi:hypothetical protein
MGLAARLRARVSGMKGRFILNRNDGVAKGGLQGIFDPHLTCHVLSPLNKIYLNGA